MRPEEKFRRKVLRAQHIPDWFADECIQEAQRYIDERLHVYALPAQRA